MRICNRHCFVYLSVSNFAQKLPNGFAGKVINGLMKNDIIILVAIQITDLDHIATLVRHALAEVCTVPELLVMAALWNRTGHYIFALWFLLSSSSIFFLFFLA